jgi:hypothetical protein
MKPLQTQFKMPYLLYKQSDTEEMLRLQAHNCMHQIKLCPSHTNYRIHISPVNNASRGIPAVTLDDSVMATGSGGACCCVKADVRSNIDIRIVEILFVGR